MGSGGGGNLKGKHHADNDCERARNDECEVCMLGRSAAVGGVECEKNRVEGGGVGEGGRGERVNCDAETHEKGVRIRQLTCNNGRVAMFTGNALSCGRNNPIICQPDAQTNELRLPFATMLQALISKHLIQR